MMNRTLHSIHVDVDSFLSPGWGASCPISKGIILESGKIGPDLTAFHAIL
ncbi:hypothetical protein KTT_56200 [Tengunoibacter tsumagoiensis]|uniref:Uncharacterized protein n=1 Tax=Tengunoibacter tsumagoiensis TaxID=2014871 RepID=A0A402AA35_9CHLR|nr:hypothetical protein KTT_56200 [Tengunoibacter tsumagoiensis]